MFTLMRRDGVLHSRYPEAGAWYDRAACPIPAGGWRATCLHFYLRSGGAISAEYKKNELIMNESRTLQKLMNGLLHSPKYAFPKQREPMLAPKAKGVYIIVSDKGLILHVGQTPLAKNGLRQRLYDHLNGRSSFVQSYLDGDGSILRNGHYYYQYIEIASSRTRVLLEALCAGTHCPKHIGTYENK